MRDSGDSVGDVRAGVVERLRARRGELVEVIFARVHDRAFGVVGARDAEYVAGLRAAVGAAVEYGLAGIERGDGDGGPPIPAVPVVALEQARRAACLGVSLDTVLRRYVVGHTLLGEFVAEEADRGEHWGEGRVLRGVLRAQAAVLDRLLREITVAYGDELARAGRSPERRRYELVRGLLEGEPVESAGLDYELEGWHLGAIATGAGAARVVRELAVGVDRRLLSVAQGERSVWAWLGGGERLAFADVEQFLAGMAAAAGATGVVFALGEPARGIEGWRLTHWQAQAALLVVLRCPVRPAVVMRYGDVALLAAALKDDMLGRALIEVFLLPLDDAGDGGAVLRHTLRAYLATERSVSSTAAALGVVRKTVANRLRTVEERTGRTLHPFPAELEIALLLDELDRP